MFDKIKKYLKTKLGCEFDNHDWNWKDDFPIRTDLEQVVTCKLCGEMKVWHSDYGKWCDCHVPIDVIPEVSAIQCLGCKDIVYSRARHDFRECSCGKSFIDGGFEYTRVGWETKKYPISFKMCVVPWQWDEDTNYITRNELYRDYNEQTNYYGLIKDGEHPPNFKNQCR